MHSELLGPFEETFCWLLKGRAAPVPLVVRGSVVGPTFSLDSTQLDYGLAAFGFRCVVGPHWLPHRQGWKGAAATPAFVRCALAAICSLTPHDHIHHLTPPFLGTRKICCSPTLAPYP